MSRTSTPRWLSSISLIAVTICQGLVECTPTPTTTTEPLTGTATGVLVGSIIGGILFLALLIVAVVLLVRKFGRPAKTHLEKRMKSSLKDGAKNGSLLPSNLDPAFANPHTQVVDTKTIEQIIKADHPIKRKLGVFGAHYSATNQAVDIHEIDNDVYEDPLLNLAIKQGSSKKGKKLAKLGNETSLPDNNVGRPEQKDVARGNHVTTSRDVITEEEDTYVDPGNIQVALSSGLPEAYMSAGETMPKENRDSAYKSLGPQSDQNINVYTNLNNGTQPGDDIGTDSIYALETDETSAPQMTEPVDGPDEDQYSLDQGESDNIYALCDEEQKVPGKVLNATENIAGEENEYSLYGEPKLAGNVTHPNQRLIYQDSEDYHDVNDFNNPNIESNGDATVDMDMYALYDSSKEQEQSKEKNNDTDMYALYDDSKQQEQSLGDNPGPDDNVYAVYDDALENETKQTLPNEIVVDSRWSQLENPVYLEFQVGDPEKEGEYGNDNPGFAEDYSYVAAPKKQRIRDGAYEGLGPQPDQNIHVYQIKHANAADK